MRHLVLYGEYELTIDDKNRMLIPSEVRKSLDSERDGDAFFLVFGTNRRPWLYPERQYERQVAEIQQDLAQPGLKCAVAADFEPVNLIKCLHQRFLHKVVGVG